MFRLTDSLNRKRTIVKSVTVGGAKWDYIEEYIPDADEIPPGFAPVPEGFVSASERNAVVDKAGADAVPSGSQGRGRGRGRGRSRR